MSEVPQYPIEQVVVGGRDKRYSSRTNLSAHHILEYVMSLPTTAPADLFGTTLHPK